MGKFLVIGWTTCPYTKRAMEELRLQGHEVVFLDEKDHGREFLATQSNWAGNTLIGKSGKWRAPHIFQLDYVGGSSQVSSWLNSLADQKQICKRYLDPLI